MQSIGKREVSLFTRTVVDFNAKMTAASTVWHKTAVRLSHCTLVPGEASV